MTTRTNMGAKMLERESERTSTRELELIDAGLMYLNHQTLLSNIRQVNGRMTRELLNSPDTLRVIDLEDAPVPINTRRFCELMAPYLCMN